MADKLISELPSFNGRTSGTYVLINNSGETETYKILREILIGGGDLIPTEDNVFTLGNSSFRWKSLSLGQGTLFITDTANPSVQAELTVTNGVLLINGTNQLQVGDLKFVGNTIESISGSTDIQIGLTASTANLVLNRNTVLASGKSLTLGAGDLDTAPLILSSGSTLTSPTPGSFEYDGKSYYTTASGLQRGVIPNIQVFYNRNQVNLVNDSSQQSLLGLANGVEVTGGVRYSFTIKFIVNAVADSVNIFFGIGGSATYLSSVYWADVGKANFLGAFSPLTRTKNTATADNIVRDPKHISYGLVGGTFWETVIHGVFDVATSGYMKPIIQFSPIPGTNPKCTENTYMEIYPIGRSWSGNTSIGNWS